MSCKIGMVSLGCAKNRVDAEMLLFTLRQAGYKLVDDVAMCDVAIVNTCGFINDAKQESIDEIIELGRLKKEGKIKAIIVTGCLAERYKSEIMKELYEVDAVLGIGANAEIASVVEKVLADKKVELFPDKYLMPLSGGRVQSTPQYYAYLKVADGCDNRCSYCAIPLIRGRFRSRELDDVAAEAEQLAENGVKELIVIAQDTTRYGEDLYGKPMLAKLLLRLCKIEKLKWIRVLYCYPDRITDELIDVIATQDKVLKYIDLPLQHCSGTVLHEMNRRGNADSIAALIKKIRERIPGVILRTTLITGFPGETDEDFRELAEFTKELKFERLGCFAYSQEEDTAAGDMLNQIDDEIKTKRMEIIMEQQQLIMSEYCEGLIGKELEVLVEGYDKYAQCWFGRSYADSPDVDGKVFFTAKDVKPKAGEFVRVLVNDFIDCDPVGEMIN